ncbi:helix-turn-helix transcriptional regulator [Neptuniibacter halophilus]|uniref:helix-turn-helix transcriptional regulator n=1 Tax=Neptuniibacter halophilus TaxID=651666 RepID=UPI0025747314|nr:LuxR C-terminal-related transcriptional regulator [Neptuniibacter halophilus]
MCRPAEAQHSPRANRYRYPFKVDVEVTQRCKRVAIIGAQPPLREVVARLCQQNQTRVQVTQFTDLNEFQSKAKGGAYPLTVIFRHVNELTFHQQLQSLLQDRSLNNGGRILILSELLGEQDRAYLRQHQADLLLPMKTEPVLLKGLLRELLQSGAVLPSHWHRWTDRLQPQFQPDLSECCPRDLRLLTLLQQGLANKQIAYRMNLSESTVKQHLGALFRRWNIKGRLQLALLARYQAGGISDRLR